MPRPGTDALYRVVMVQQVVTDQGLLLSEDGKVVPGSAFAAVAGSLAGTYVASATVHALVTLTKAAYTAISVPVATTLYITTDTGGIFYGDLTIVAGT